LKFDQTPKVCDDLNYLTTVANAVCLLWSFVVA